VHNYYGRGECNGQKRYAFKSHDLANARSNRWCGTGLDFVGGVPVKSAKEQLLDDIALLMEIASNKGYIVSTAEELVWEPTPAEEGHWDRG
jgi:hypothetical protein